jgi:hypothetical protein
MNQEEGPWTQEARKPRRRGPEVLFLRISLKGSEPEVWRRVLVHSDTTLQGLHRVIQIVMQWQDYHLYEFVIRGERYEATMEAADVRFLTFRARSARRPARAGLLGAPRAPFFGGCNGWGGGEWASPLPTDPSRLPRTIWLRSRKRGRILTGQRRRGRPGMAKVSPDRISGKAVRQ